MASIINAIKDMFASVFEFVGAIFSTAFGLVQDVFNLFLNLLRSIFSSIGWVLDNFLDLLKAFVELVLGNIVIIGVIIVGAVGYAFYQQNQGKPITGKKRA